MIFVISVTAASQIKVTFVYIIADKSIFSVDDRRYLIIKYHLSVDVHFPVKAVSIEHGTYAGKIALETEVIPVADNIRIRTKYMRCSGIIDMNEIISGFSKVLVAVFGQGYAE